MQTEKTAKVRRSATARMLTVRMKLDVLEIAWALNDQAARLATAPWSLSTASSLRAGPLIAPKRETGA
jgi:hypothetical protein